MKRKQLKLAFVSTLFLAALAAMILVRHWKLRSDRAGCLINMRNMYKPFIRLAA